MNCFYPDQNLTPEVLIQDQLSRKIKAHEQNLMLVEVLFENGAVGERHSHEHEQIAYCVEGEFDYYIGDECYFMVTGDSAYVPPNVEHGCKLKSPKGRLLDIFTPQREDFLV